MNGPRPRMFGKDIEHPRTSMSKEIATRVACWLRSKTRVKAARPVTVQIGRRSYSAARYTEANKRGLQDRLYIIGEMPPLQNRLRGVCYRTDHSDDGWHLLAWVRLKQCVLSCEKSRPSVRTSSLLSGRNWRIGLVNRVKADPTTASQ